MIRHIIFLIHPCCYEGLDAATLRDDDLLYFLDLESQVKGRWFAALAAKPADTLFVQLGGPEYLVETARRELGQAHAVQLTVPFPESRSMHEYYEALVKAVHAHLQQHDLRFDPATVTSELWGESFEGCVPGYGGAFAQYLGLEQSPRMRFEMTVHDSRFICGAKAPQVIPLPDSDVEGWVFECHDGTAAAIFQTRRHAQWIDDRRIELQLNTMRHQVWNKRGHTLWPETEWAKHDPIETKIYTFTLAQAIWRWIRTTNMPMAPFQKVIAAARVLPPAP